MRGVSQHSRIGAGGERSFTSKHAEEHVVSIFLAHMLSLIATVIPFNSPRETRVGSSGMTYTSAFTLAFFSLTVRHHENCVTVVERIRDESL